MIRSMTGFGRGEARFGSGKITIEIKTVNHKFFDSTLKLPNNINIFEDDIKEVLQKSIKRGKVNLNLVYDGELLKEEKISVNMKAARGYHAALSEINRKLKLADGITAKDLVALPGVLNYQVVEEKLARFWPKIKEALEKSIKKVITEREREGSSLKKDLARHAARITKMLSQIKSRAHLNIDDYRRKFAERVKDLSNGRQIDLGRLEMEVAIFAKNSDISEEVARLENHLKNFSKTISGAGEVGKKLDFIAQELHRETNTIGSKASDFRISRNVIDIKGEIEKIREQAKNIE